MQDDYDLGEEQPAERDELAAIKHFRAGAA